MGVGEQLYDIKTGGKKTDHGHGDPPLVRRRRKTGNLKPMRFVSLHHHSTFSYKDGFALPEAHVRRAEELNMGAFALTEHGNVSSHVKFEKAIGDSGIKPIYGCEVYTGKVGEKASATKYHLTLLAKDLEGYQNLLALVSKSYSEGFYYEPTVSWRMLNEHKKGLIVLSGCQGSLLFCSAVGGKKIDPDKASYKRALGVAQKFKKAFGRNYFIEVQAFPELESTVRFNSHFAPRLARAVGVRLVGTMDVHYTHLDESEMQAILHNIRGGTRKTLEEQAREWGYEVPLCPPPDDKSIYRRLRGTGLSHDDAIQAVVSTEEIAQECTLTLPKLDMVRFPVPHKDGDTAQEVWDAWLKEGWAKRKIDSLPAGERKKRVKQFKREKKIIEDKGYVDYILIVADSIRYMKDQNIPVWLRGSAGASFICFLLGISDIDPMDYPMLRFERFIDLTREDLPDIDADFPSEARGMLRDYLVAKYGEKCVNNLGTFQYYKPKLALDDTARVFRIPKFKVERVKDFLIERSSGDLRASSSIEDTISEFKEARDVFDEHPELYKSFELEGNIKGHGVHAAGLVISNDDVRKVASVLAREMPKNSGNWIDVLGIDKYDAEYLGMVKMDYLGLATMSLLWNCLKYLDMSLDEMNAIPLDDEEVYRAFKRNDVVGIFQFDGRACRYVSSAVKPENFLEVCDITALARPGALHNGAARDYAEIKHGYKDLPELHPAIAPILEPTKGQIVYQEQILRMVREVGDFSWTAASEIRRIIAKKHGEQAFNRRKKMFLAGAETLHERHDVPKMTRKYALDLWGDMITAGSYGFNAAHALMYGLLGYRTMWFKVHHPDIYYATALAAYGDKKQHDLLRDCAKRGIRVLSPSPRRSAVTWQPVRRKRRPLPVPTIRAGFDEIGGIGEATAEQIIMYREDNGLEDWDSLINVKGIGEKTVEKIKGWVEQEDPFGAFALDGNIRSVKRQIEKGKLGDLPVPTHTAQDIPVEQGREVSVVWLGTVLERNIRDIFEQNRARKGEELKRSEVKDPHLNEFALLTAEDETDQLLLKMDRWKFPRFKEALFNFKMKRDLMLVEGVRPAYVSARQVKVKKLWVIEP